MLGVGVGGFPTQSVTLWPRENMSMYNSPILSKREASNNMKCSNGQRQLDNSIRNTSSLIKCFGLGSGGFLSHRRWPRAKQKSMFNVQIAKPNSMFEFNSTFKVVASSSWPTNDSNNKQNSDSNNKTNNGHNDTTTTNNNDNDSHVKQQ